MRRSILFAAVLVAACSPQPESKVEPPPVAAPAPVAADIPAGSYTIDHAHSTVVFRVNHIGFSNYTAQFTEIGATLQLDPADPERSSVEVTIPVRSLQIPTPPAGFRDTLMGAAWFDAAQFPNITFRSTRVEPTGADTARITGDLTLHGVTRPIVLEATFNGGWAGIPQDPHARVGFSARGSLKRSEFGMGYGVPPPGSAIGVVDDVAVAIEAEFTGPPWAGAPQP